MTTAKDLAKLIGKKARYQVDGLTFMVWIADADYQWGQISYHIMPVDGTGSKWVRTGVTVVD